MTTEILAAEIKTDVAAYQPFYAQLMELEINNAKLAFNYEDKKDNKAARSHVYSLRQTKSALDKTRKEAKADYLRLGKAVDSEAAEIELRIEAMIKVHQVKLDEIEARETQRIADIRVKLGVLSEIHHGKSAADYKFHLATLEAVAIDDKWQEFIAEAAQAKNIAIAKHRELLADREKSDAEVAELETLRKQKAEQDQKDRDAAIVAAVVEQASKDEAERTAKAEAAAKQAITDAEAKAAKEREDAARRELELKLQAETAERRRVEAEQKAEQDTKAAIERAEKSRLQAIADEKARVAAEAKADADALAKREANKAHLRKINAAACTAMIAGGMSEIMAKLAITMIARGEVPAITINY